mmetsp:Transcript_11738/g.34718  ORF Transcript_11738/g.34718 Transcript_11738/m.34718 type:complete len:365 (+) Transcript_11738:854-1948(+)
MVQGRVRRRAVAPNASVQPQQRRLPRAGGDAASHLGRGGDADRRPRPAALPVPTLRRRCARGAGCGGQGGAPVGVDVLGRHVRPRVQPGPSSAAEQQVPPLRPHAPRPDARARAGNRRRRQPRPRHQRRLRSHLPRPRRPRDARRDGRALPPPDACARGARGRAARADPTPRPRRASGPLAPAVARGAVLSILHSGRSLAVPPAGLPADTGLQAVRGLGAGLVERAQQLARRSEPVRVPGARGAARHGPAARRLLEHVHRAALPRLHPGRRQRVQVRRVPVCVLERGDCCPALLQLDRHVPTLQHVRRPIRAPQRLRLRAAADPRRAQGEASEVLPVPGSRMSLKLCVPGEGLQPADAQVPRAV